MAILSSCCCWKSVRRGSFASGIYTLLYYTVLVIGGTFQIDSNENHAVNDTTGEVPSGNAGANLGFIVFLLACAGLSVLASIVLLVGLCADNRIMLLPWIFCISLTTLVCFVFSIFLITTMSFEANIAAVFTLDFFISVLNVYCLLCVISQYQEYKAGRGRPGDYRGFYDPRYPQPTVRFEPPSLGQPSPAKRAVTFQENGMPPNGFHVEDKILLTVEVAAVAKRPKSSLHETNEENSNPPSSRESPRGQNQLRTPSPSCPNRSPQKRVHFCSDGDNDLTQHTDRSPNGRKFEEVDLSPSERPLYPVNDSEQLISSAETSRSLQTV